MPEVLRVIARLNLGGPARHVLRVTAPLAAHGFDTTLAVGRCEPHEPELLDEAAQAGVSVVLVPGLGRAPRPADDLAALAALRRLVAERRPAIVHTHTAKAGTLGRVAALCQRRRPLLVHTFHGHVLDGYFGPLASAAAAGTERLLARGTQRLLAVSTRVRDELLHRHRVGRPAQWRVLPPGIDVERTRPDRAAGAALRAGLGIGAHELLLGVVGRLDPIKRVPAAVEAFAALPAGAARLLVMGDGSHGSAVRARLATLPGAHWLPPQRDLCAVWGALDLALLPSHREGLPQVVVEALSAGVPVLAHAVGGLPELVRDGVDGVLVPPGDAPAFAAALAALVADRPRLARLRQAALAVPRDEHRPEAVADGLAALYDELLRRPVASSPVLAGQRS